jgi:hypothetical protein
MSKAKKPMSERAVDRLEEKEYLKNVRAVMRAEVMKCLVDLTCAAHDTLPRARS